MRLAASLKRTQEQLLDLIFPPSCVLCRQPGSMLCDDCLADLPRKPGTGPVLSHDRQAPPHDIDGIFSVLHLEGKTRRAVHLFKYENRPTLAAPLAGLMAEYYGAHPIPVDLVLPVPLHPARERERGYNQADLLARSFGCMVDIPTVSDGLKRVRPTRAQVGLNASQRRQNVRGAFVWQPGGEAPALPGQRILLIDDVCTTGATLEACSAALKASGAASVWGFTLARAS